ncbi:hypothetical protein J6590_068768 [Homalodisca vitripennis]|nr:hypothetical protein J6590_068768 [Homalodisca vitripennis]
MKLNDVDSFPLRLALHQHFLGFEQSMMIWHVKKNSTAGRNLIMASKHSLCSCYTVAIFVIRSHG